MKILSRIFKAQVYETYRKTSESFSKDFAF